MLLLTLNQQCQRTESTSQDVVEEAFAMQHRHQTVLHCRSTQST